LKGIVPKGISMGDIYKSVIPYTLVELTGLVIIMLFPQIAVWLPNKLL
jgi:TRAP-type mannitol/chloroaromatic compound transport system permease large subunit